MYVAFFDALLKWWDNATSPLCTLNAKRARKFPSIPTIPLLKCNSPSYRCPRNAIPSLPQSRIVSTIGTNLSRVSSAALRCCSDNWYATQNRRQKIFNRWAWHPKIWQKLLICSVGYFNLGELEILFAGLSPPKPSVATGLMHHLLKDLTHIL